MMKETVLTKRDLIYPLFVVEGENICREIETLPGVYHYSIDRLCEALDEMREAQVLSCILRHSGVCTGGYRTEGDSLYQVVCTGNLCDWGCVHV